MVLVVSPTSNLNSITDNPILGDGLDVNEFGFELLSIAYQSVAVSKERRAYMKQFIWNVYSIAFAFCSAYGFFERLYFVFDALKAGELLSALIQLVLISFFATLSGFTGALTYGTLAVVILTPIYWVYKKIKKI